MRRSMSHLPRYGYEDPDASKLNLNLFRMYLYRCVLQGNVRSGSRVIETGAIAAATTVYSEVGE